MGFQCFREQIVCPIRRPTAQSISDNKPRTVDDPKLLAVNFSNPVCCNSAIVGGKGAQLAFLTQLHAKVFDSCYNLLTVVLLTVLFLLEIILCKTIIMPYLWCILLCNVTILTNFNMFSANKMIYVMS